MADVTFNINGEIKLNGHEITGALTGLIGAEVEPITITENGTYTAETGKAYSPVTVEVPTVDTEALTVTENGTYTAPEGKAYTPVIVNTPQPTEEVLLWENPNPTTQIASLTIPFDFSKYTAAKIKWRYSTSNSGIGPREYTSIIAPFDSDHNVYQIGSMQSTSIGYTRGVYVTTDNLNITWANRVGATTRDNNYIIPLEVYGIK